MSEIQPMTATIFTDGEEKELMSLRAGHNHQIVIEIPFATEEHARIARDVLLVDSEVDSGKSTRSVAIRNGTNAQDGANILVVLYETKSLKLLRTCVSSLFDSVGVIARVFEMFGQDTVSK